MTQSSKYEDIVKNISRLILTNQKKMTREKDLRNLCENFNFDQVINDVYLNLQNIGFDLIKTKFLEQNYYLLTIGGKDDDITPSQYGTLALILALTNEIDENIKISDLKEIFSNVWDTDIKFLIENDYLRQITIEGADIVKITPLGKATMKNIIHDLQLKNLLDIFK
ncbi:MAG: hypothetical protein EU532_08065 [Promethearchaeota archaeon]|nr:MAG: hypothetical protein EU532_08065 [Candidatus Lokiarchaeota archaeon]